MKTILLISFSIFLTSGAFSHSEEWTHFKEKFGRTYKSTVEEQVRSSIFQENLKKIEAHNQEYLSGKSSYYMGVNQFADMTPEEFVSSRLATTARLDALGSFETIEVSRSVDIPEQFDWREKGAVTPVKDQGFCGCCYIFAAIGSIESQNFIGTGQLVSLSEQQVLDCDNYNNKCNWGWPQKVYQHISEHGAVTTEAYPAYAATVELCRDNGTLFKGMGYLKVPSDEHDLATTLVTHGPVAVSIDARNMGLYAGGVYFDPECSTMSTNHVVVVVGYGSEKGGDYWLVKNSWGTTFGEGGYIKMARNKNNNCAIASYPFVPTL